MRKFVIFIFYSFFLILLGRNLTFIPKVNLPNEAQPKDPEIIRQDILNFLKDQKGNYSVYYQDLTSGDNFGIFENTILTGASLNNLPIVGYLYYLAGKNEINLEETVVIQKEDLQNYGTGTLQYENPGQAYTLKDLAQLTLQHSDNTAAHVLEIRLGENNIQSFASQIGMGATDMVNNNISARDVGKFLELLYKNKITTPVLTKELLGFMENTDAKDRIAKYLPKNLSIYQQAGDAAGIVNNSAIINSGKAPFILVVLANNITDEAKAKDAIGQIAIKVFNDRGKR